MSLIAAFGVPVFGPNKKSKAPPVIVKEINAKLSDMGISADDVVSIQAEQDFYHVFYRVQNKAPTA